MAKLYEFASLIRSKNAASFMITLDVVFPDHEQYEKVLATGALDVSNVAACYALEPEKMHRYCLPKANAVKFSYPRTHPSGDFLDNDLYGCQKHAPLVNLEIPLERA